MFSRMTSKQAKLGGIFITLIIGGFIVISRFGVRESFSAADLTALRYSSGLVLLPIFFRLDFRSLGGIGWTGEIAFTIGAGWPFNMLLMTGFNYAPAAHGAVFGPGTMPMFTAILNWFILGDRLNIYRSIGLVAITVGLVMLGWGGFLDSSPGAWIGDLYFLSGAFFLGKFYGCRTPMEY